MADFDMRTTLLYDANKKSVFLAYVFWLFLGCLAIHRFYVRKWETGACQFLLMAIGSSLIFSPSQWSDKVGDPGQVGLVLLGLWGAWMLLDILFIPTMVRKYNVRLVDELSAG